MTDPKPDPKEETPGLDFTFDVEVDGQSRKTKMSPGGLFVFDVSEKFKTNEPKPRPIPPLPSAATGRWIGFKRPMSDGNVLTPPRKPGDFKTIKVRGLTIKSILGLTKKRG
jgi:hypothetical protein